jgi:predicted Zn-dependent protease with MMP-like domain
VQLSEERFRELVGETLDDLPEWVQKTMDNVVIVVEDCNSDEPDLRGLYSGHSLTERDGYGMLDLPDVITLYRDAITGMCADEDEVAKEVRVTVIHEIAHHFDMDDDRLDGLGWG